MRRVNCCLEMKIIQISHFIIYHHHHHVVLVARISLTLSRHFSLSFIASGYVIGVVGVGNCFCWVPSASFLCQLEAVLSDFVNRCSKYVV